MSKHYCNAECMFNDNQDQTCDTAFVYHVNRQCVTFRKRPRKEDYRGLMRTYETNLERDRRKTTRIMGVLK